jgi:hypothetical protein
LIGKLIGGCSGDKQSTGWLGLIRVGRGRMVKYREGLERQKSELEAKISRLQEERRHKDGSGAA